MGKTNPTYRDVIDAKEDDWDNFRRMLRRHKQSAFESVVLKMRKNSDAADYLNPTDPRLGMDLSLYVEAELERQELQTKVDNLEEEIEQLKSYMAAREVERDAEDTFQ